MHDIVYLTFTASGVTAMHKSHPRLRVDEYAVEVQVAVADAYFDRDIPVATLDIEQRHIITPEVEVEVHEPEPPDLDLLPLAGHLFAGPARGGHLDEIGECMAELVDHSGDVGRLRLGTLADQLGDGPLCFAVVPRDRDPSRTVWFWAARRHGDSWELRSERGRTYMLIGDPSVVGMVAPVLRWASETK